jgi:hypothetical protein
MDLSLVGPGRAGLALTLAARAAGHRIVAVLARDPEAAVAAAARLEAPVMAWDAALPKCDLLLVAVRDDAIAAVARHFAARSAQWVGAIHLSGLTPVTALDALPIRSGRSTIADPAYSRERGGGSAGLDAVPPRRTTCLPTSSSPSPRRSEPTLSNWPTTKSRCITPLPLPPPTFLGGAGMSERLFTAAGVDCRRRAVGGRGSGQCGMGRRRR